MANLEYLYVLSFRGVNAPHNFVVSASNNTVYVYVAPGSSHNAIARRFDILDDIAGGGSCYINCENQLVLDGFSADYGGIPKAVTEEFAKLIRPEIEKLGIEIRGIIANPTEYMLSGYWRKRGFSPSR